jgi:exopolysaccharide biosynthesis polyprenyl glycosylphosphotransferase
MAIVYSIYPHARLENGAFLVGMLLALPFLILWRQTFLWAINSLRLCEKTVVIGHGPLAVALENEIRMRRELGLNIVGYFDNVSDGGSEPSETRFLGNLDELAERVGRYSATRIIIAMEDRRGKLPIDELLLLKTRGLAVQDGAELYENITGKVQLESLRAGGLLFSTGFRTSRALLVYKRCFSIVFSALFTAITLPLMLVAAVAIRLESKGPIIFRQQRVGKNGKIFTIFKFRTMRHDPDVISTQKAVQKDDDRVTAVGRWLRRTRLDELPQLFNILRGEMYFVGPRPFPLEQEKELVRQIPFYRQRWAARPGATGWAQINRGYNATLQDNVEKLSYDLFYIKNVSVGLDLLILFQTFKILLFGRGAR